MKIPISLHPHQNLLLSVFLIIAILVNVKGYLIMVLICISLMISDVERLFLVLIYHWYIFFGEMFIQIPCSKETINKTKGQPSEWEKTFANEATDKGLISKIYKQLNIKQTTQSKNGQKT